MAITAYVDFVNDYLVKNGMIGNATNINKAPDKLKLELDELNTAMWFDGPLIAVTAFVVPSLKVHRSDVEISGQ